MTKKLLSTRIWLLSLLFLTVSLRLFGQVYTIGTGTSSTGGSYGTVSPVNNYYESYHMQILYKASELVAEGMTAAGFLDSLAWNIDGAPSYTLPNYTVKIKHTSATAVGASLDDGDFTTVYTTSSFAPTGSSWNWLVFSTPFFWNGSDNILVDVCYGVAANWSYTGTAYYTSTSFNSVFWQDQDDATLCGSPNSDAQTTTYRPNIKLGYTEAEDCVGAPVAGTIAGVDSICGSTAFSLTTSGGTMAAGITYQWQSSPSGTGTWTDISGATGSAYSSSAGISESTDYRLIINCTESALADTSDIYTVVKKDASECYCEPYSTGYTYGCSYWRIDNFSTTGGISNISNLNTNCSSGSYGDYTSMSASQYQGSTVNYDIKLEYPGGSSTGKVKMWIDWNQDGVFSTSEVIYENATASSAASLTGTFEVPSTAVAGMTRIRIKTQQYYDITSECAFATYDYNEVEDYSFEVVVPDPCEDATFTDITLSGPTGVCSGVEGFSITSEGTPIASGLTKVWETAPAGSGDWTTVTGASMSYLSVASITEATDYRYTVTCVATGESVVSDTWTVELNPPTECYCDIDYMYGCSYYIQVDDFSTTGGISDISNLGTGCAGSTGYGDYTDMIASAYQGTLLNYDIELVNPSGSVKMWVDWNQDGDFSDSGELMYTSSTTSSTAPSSISGSFEIPYDAPAGPTGIRIRTFAYYPAYDYLDACYDHYYGETEDYTLEVVVPDPCDEVPFTGLTIEGPENICAANTFTITSDGTPIASGLTRTWQMKTAGGSWTTISGAASLNYTATTGITEATDFRYIVTCTLTGESDTSNVLSITMNPPTECYCEAEFYGAYDMDMYTWNDYKIKDFIINGQTDTLFSLNTPFPFDGTSPGDLGGYTDYTSDTSLHIPDLVQTGTYSGQVKVRYSSPYVIDRVWIDYDDDGVFGSTDVIHTSTTSYPAHSSSSPDNFSFTIPPDANPGLHRMRVRAIYLYSSPLPIDPCYTYQYGQTQDYMVEIQELKPCAEVTFPESVGATSTPPNVCGTGDITLKLTSAMPLADGITYQWKSSNTETGTYTNVGPELSAFAGPTLTLTGVSTDKYYKCYILCEGEPILISDAVYVQSVDLESVVITTEGGQTCGPGPVTLAGSSSDGSVFWYLEAEGGSPVWMGDEYITPSLTVTDTFYATGGAFGASNGIVGDGTSTSYYYDYGPFTPYYGAKALQYMYTADELHDAGITNAGDIESIAFNMATLPDIPLANYTIQIKTVTTAPLTWQTSGWTTVYSEASFEPEATGWTTFPFSSPFTWNGTDNIVVQICYTTPDASYYWDYYPGGTHKYTSKSGRGMYYYNYSTTTSACASSYYSGTTMAIPNAKFYIPGCETDRVPVIAYVRPVPAPINIGPDETICKDANNGLTLDAGDQPATYTFLWDNGTIEQTRRITESGTYYVEVANEFGCPVYDTVTKNLLDIPMVELGGDTTVCEGGFVTLDAGPDGNNYYWSTGATTRRIDVIAGGEYTVLVANENDCISLDTINVTVSGTMPSVASIIVTNMGLYTFNFEPLLPAHIVSYEWDFGDGSPVSTSEAPTHTYAASGSYTVTLTVKSECGEVIYTTTAHIVGVNNVSADDQSVTLYPNPAKDIAMIESKGNLKMKSVTVTNVLGQVMYHDDVTSTDKHQLELSRYASGVYTVRIDTDKGVIVRKFEIVK